VVRCCPQASDMGYSTSIATPYRNWHLSLELNVDEMGLLPFRPGLSGTGSHNGRHTDVHAVGAASNCTGATHCQKVSVRPSRSSSTPLPGFAEVADHTARSPISLTSIMSHRNISCSFAKSRRSLYCDPQHEVGAPADHVINGALT